MRVLFSLVLISLVTVANVLAQDWESIKRELDAVCEEAREDRLRVDRAQYVDECVEKQQKENPHTYLAQT